MALPQGGAGVTADTGPGRPRMSPKTVTCGTGKGPNVKGPPGGQTRAMWASDSWEGMCWGGSPARQPAGRVVSRGPKTPPQRNAEGHHREPPGRGGGARLELRGHHREPPGRSGGEHGWNRGAEGARPVTRQRPPSKGDNLTPTTKQAEAQRRGTRGLQKHRAETLRDRRPATSWAPCPWSHRSVGRTRHPGHGRGPV